MKGKEGVRGYLIFIFKVYGNEWAKYSHSKTRSPKEIISLGDY